APLPVGDLWGVGAKTAERLERYGIRTVADVRATPRRALARILTPALAEGLWRLAVGADARSVIPYEPAKGMSNEETFDRDVDDPAQLRRELLRLSAKLARRLRDAGVAGRTVTLKLRYANVTTITRSKTLPLPTDESTLLHAETTALIDAQRL